MKITLPSLSFPLSATLPADTDPLGHMLKRVVPFSSYGSSPKEETVWGILAALSQVTFDPNVTVDGPNGAPHTALHCALLLTENTKPRRPFRHWPLELDGFSDALIQEFTDPLGKPSRDAVDGEWLAAVLLAAGANPWAGREDHPFDASLGGAFNRALGLGMTGLADRMWQVEEGRPSVDELTHTLLEQRRVGDSRFASGTWLELSVQREDTALTTWLLERGVRPLPDRPHPLGNAHSSAHIEAFRVFDLLPETAAEKRAVESAWRARLKKRDITPETMVALQQSMSAGPSGAAQMSKEAQSEAMLGAKIEQALALTKWDERCAGSVTFNMSVDALCQQGVVSKGALAGQWNLMVAEFINSLRADHPRGAMPVDLCKMIQHEYIDGKWMTASLPESGGALAAARGFEWREGVSIDGFLVLGVLGMSDTDQRDSRDRGPTQDQPLIQAAAQVLGIEDVQAWAVEHAASAVVATETLAKGGADPALQRLRTIWKTVLDRHPTLLKESPDLGARLLKALTFNFKRSTGVSGDRFPYKNSAHEFSLPMSSIIHHVWPEDTFEVPTSLAGMTKGQRALVLEVALLIGTKPWVALLSAADTGLTASECQRIDEVMKNQAKAGVFRTIDQHPFDVLLRRIVLEASFPQVPEAKPNRPRM